MIDALQSSEELQTCLRQYIRNELQVMGPKILAKVKADLNLEEAEQPQQLPAKGHWEKEVPELLKRSSWKAAEEE